MLNLADTPSKELFDQLTVSNRSRARKETSAKMHGVATLKRHPFSSLSLNTQINTQPSRAAKSPRKQAAAQAATTKPAALPHDKKTAEAVPPAPHDKENSQVRECYKFANAASAAPAAHMNSKMPLLSGKKRKHVEFADVDGGDKGSGGGEGGGGGGGGGGDRGVVVRDQAVPRRLDFQALHKRILNLAIGAQLTCFTSTKIQILTQKALHKRILNVATECNFDTTSINFTPGSALQLHEELPTAMGETVRPPAVAAVEGKNMKATAPHSSSSALPPPPPPRKQSQYLKMDPRRRHAWWQHFQKRGGGGSRSGEGGPLRRAASSRDAFVFGCVREMKASAGTLPTGERVADEETEEKVAEEEEEGEEEEEEEEEGGWSLELCEVHADAGGQVLQQPQVLRYIYVTLLLIFLRIELCEARVDAGGVSVR